MRIALINENSQAAKNGLIEATLRKVVEPLGHTVDNYGMYSAEDENTQVLYFNNAKAVFYSFTAEPEVISL